MRASPRFFFFLTALFAGSAVACSSASSSGGGPQDAGTDSSRPAQQDSGSDPFGGGGGRDAGVAADGGDAGTCAQLKAQIDKLGTTARACNPSAAGAQCNGQTNGPCCPISVSAGTDPSAIENYDQAVKNYVAQCSPDCSMVICQPTPSNVCDGTGSSGICR